MFVIYREDSSRAIVTLLVACKKGLYGILPATRRKEECKENLRWKIEREVYICTNNDKAIQGKKSVLQVPVVPKKQVPLVPVPIGRLQKFT